MSNAEIKWAALVEINIARLTAKYARAKSDVARYTIVQGIENELSTVAEYCTPRAAMWAAAKAACFA